jgi:hypothetical protein
LKKIRDELKKIKRKVKNIDKEKKLISDKSIMSIEELEHTEKAF